MPSGRSRSGICQADDVSSEPSPAGDASAVPRMPASVRVATISLGVLAALFLTFGALLAYRFDVTVTNTVGDGGTITRDEAREVLRASLIVFLILGVLLALSAWFLPRRQAWARWMGVAVTALLILINLFTMATGAFTL